MPFGVRNGSSRNVSRRLTLDGFGQHADVDDAIAFQNVRRNLAEQRGVRGVGDVLTLKPNRAASAGRTRKLIEGPVSVRPSNVSTMPGIFLICSSTRGAVCLQPFQIGRE